MGCTTEFNKWEGITYDAANKKLYTAISSVEGAMENSHPSNDKGTENRIRVGKNSCGCVMEMVLDYKFSPFRSRMLTCGIPNTDPLTKAVDACVTDHIANPDNVAMISRFNQLIIGEDTVTGHQNDLIWIFDLPTGAMTRIASTPYGSETTSPYWFTVGDWDYMSYVIQHPYGESDQAMLIEAANSGICVFFCWIVVVEMQVVCALGELRVHI